jgi:hypothetical protein
MVDRNHDALRIPGQEHQISKSRGLAISAYGTSPSLTARPLRSQPGAAGLEGGTGMVRTAPGVVAAEIVGVWG